MKKQISLLSLAGLLFSLVPTLAFAYSGVTLANTEADGVSYCNYSGGFYICAGETTDASDAGVDDVYLPTDENDNLVVGFSEMFDGVALDVTTDADGYDSTFFDTAGGRYDFEYWNGTDWIDLEYSLGSMLTTTYDFDNGSEGVLYKTWIRPDDWATKVITTASSSSLYYVRLIATADYSTTGLAGGVGIIDYNLKVEVLDELGYAIEGLEESDFVLAATGSADDTIYAFEDLGDGLYGFAVDAPTATGSEYELSVFPSGFVEQDPARTAVDLDFGETLYDDFDIPYSHLFMAENEAGIEVGIEEATAGVTPVDCLIDGVEAYCPVDIGNDGSGAEAYVYTDGYVALTGTITNRNSSNMTQAQESYVLDYGYVATVKDAAGNPLTSATVKAGDDLSLTCDYIGSGHYGCPISLSDAEPLVRISATGYETLDSVFGSERSAPASAQVATTFRLTEDTGEPDPDPTPDPTDDGTDTDSDGLTDVEEGELGTDENDSDSDNDGIRDGAEVDGATDPLDSSDYLANGEDFYIDCSDPFVDTAGNFAEQSICILHDEGVVQGRSSTEYEPSASITRAEFLKIALLNAGLTVTEDSSVEYDDVDASAWYYSYVTYATAEGYVEGYDDGTFHPDEEINRAEAMIMMLRIAGVAETTVSESDITFDDVSSSDWFAWAVVEASDNKISEGYEDDTFKPGNSITRAEVAVIARRVWYVYYE